MFALLSIPSIDHLRALKDALDDACDLCIENTTKDNADVMVLRYHRLASMRDEVIAEFNRPKENKV